MNLFESVVKPEDPQTIIGAVDVRVAFESVVKPEDPQTLRLKRHSLMLFESVVKPEDPQTPPAHAATAI